jgi:hypothetical protein
VARERGTRTFVMMGWVLPLFIIPTFSALPPIYAKDVFHGGPETLGFSSGWLVPEAPREAAEVVVYASPAPAWLRAILRDGIMAPARSDDEEGQRDVLLGDKVAAVPSPVCMIFAGEA